MIDLISLWRGMLEESCVLYRKKGVNQEKAGRKEKLGCKTFHGLRAM